MKTQVNHLDIPLECYKNGELDIFSLENAAEELPRANYGWIVPSNLYIWNVDGIIGCNRIYPLAGEKGLLLALYVHTNLQQPFSVRDAETLIHTRKDELKDNTFTTWVSRFNSIFKEPLIGDGLPRDLWPFHHVKIPSGIGNIMWPAYQMCPARTSFVVVGVDVDSRYKTIPVQWSLLLSKVEGLQISGLFFDKATQKLQERSALRTALGRDAASV